MHAIAKVLYATWDAINHKVFDSRFIQYGCRAIQKHKVNKALNDKSDSLNSSSDERDDMELNSAPKMDWTSNDLPTAWRASRHCKFEEEKCNYLMI